MATSLQRCRGAESRAVQAAGDVLEVRAALAAAQVRPHADRM